MTEYLIGIGPARPRASCVGVAPFRLACQPWRGVGRNRNAGEKRRARPRRLPPLRAKFRMSVQSLSACGVGSRPQRSLSGGVRTLVVRRPLWQLRSMRSPGRRLGLGSAQARSFSNASIQMERVAGCASRHHRGYCPKRPGGAIRSRRYSRNTCCMDCPLAGLRNRRSERGPVVSPRRALLPSTREPRLQRAF